MLEVHADGRLRHLQVGQAAEFDGDASDGTPLDPLHQMCHIPDAENNHNNVFKCIQIKHR
ncbi:hypothetical protein F7725_023486 [Dissostichus mawsoni]|uniref:Uncharacterized protein n=1 Tax=Dissostichus mawsoni TaxID=36200 RepID=A0A7J5Z0U3_DISMA|nr:hypothetical protein F7725_023486 [Dissostichus mawsoni]